MRPVALAVALTLLVTATPVGAAADTGTGNEPPLADAGLDQRVEQGAEVWLDGGGSVDPDGEIVAYEWSIRTPDGGTVRPSDSGASSTTFGAESVGRYEVTLTVTGGDGATRSDTMYVDVAAADGASGESSESNEPPTGEIRGPDTVDPGERATFTADVYDPDGEVVEYEWSNGDSGRRIARSIDRPAGETFEFTVRVVDDDSATTTLRTSVRVRSPDADGSRATDPSNRDPTAEIEGPDRVAVGQDAAFVLRGSDSDGTVVRREWTGRGETGAVLEPTFGGPGAYTLRGVVVDDDGARAVATKAVEVYEEGPPVVEISGPDTAPAGSTQAYTLEASDPDGGEVTIRWDPAQTRLERTGDRYVNNVGIEGELGDSVEVTATVTDDEGNTVTAVKETEVMKSVASDLGNTKPQISRIGWEYHHDEPSQTSETPETDSVELSSYNFSAKITHQERKIVRTTWRINDSSEAVIVDTLGRFSGSRYSFIRHMFVSENGGKVSREVSVTAIDADGDQSEQKWVSRVHSVQSHEEMKFYATMPRSSKRVSSPHIEPGDSIMFHVGSYQNYRLKFGDGSWLTGSGTTAGIISKFEHTYEDPGRYKIRLISTQGPKGEALKTIDVVVQPDSYTEYWYETTTNTVSQVVSEERPSGDSWSKISVHNSRKDYTGRTITVRDSSGRPGMLGENWVLNDTTTERRTRTVTRVRKSDPDGAGDDWKLNERNVRTEERTYYEDQYQWLPSSFGRKGWTFTGETRSEKIVIGDGHDHDRERHERTTQTCTNWELEPDPFGGFSRHCARWDYDTDVWYTGHDHDGRIDYDTEYRYKTEVERTETVRYHEYVGTQTQTVRLNTFAETNPWIEWLWEREGTTVRQEYSLKMPEDGSYVSGTLKTVEVRCGSDESHHDQVMC